MLKQIPDFDTAELDLKSHLSGRESACPPLSVLRALEEDCLPVELAGPAREHLSRCRLCQMLVMDTASLPEPQFLPAQQERIATRFPTNAARSSFWSMQRSLIAIAAVLLLTAGLFLRSHRERNLQVASVKPAGAEAPLQIKEIPFTPLSPPQGPADLLTRGSAAEDGPSNEELLPAFRAYNRSDYTAAAQEFETLSRRYPQSQLIFLYLGVAQVALHRDEDAVATLHHARGITKPYDADAAQWYSAVAASRTHQAEALPLLEALCQKKASDFSARSCQALQTADSGK